MKTMKWVGVLIFKTIYRADLHFVLFQDVDVPVCRKSCGKPAVERILEFGRELHSMNQRLKLEQNFSENNEKMLTVNLMPTAPVSVLLCNIF